VADVKNIITKGIGASPGSIHFFVLFGLDVGMFSAPTSRTYPVPAEARALAVDSETRVMPVPQETRVLAVR